MRIDAARWQLYSSIMSTVEFAADLTETPVLTIPSEVAARLPKAGKARVIVIIDGINDEAEWQSAAYEQFLRDDSPEDAVYDSLR
jgi:hypothetical protein